MKTVLLCALLFASGSVAFAADRSPACEAKRASIEAEIAQATSQGRSQQVSGLKRALAANMANCSDASLAKERDERIREAQRKVASRENGLAEAQRKGDAKKIAERKAKLDEARAGLAEAEAPIGQ